MTDLPTLALAANLEAAIGTTLAAGAQRIATTARANAPVLRTPSSRRVPGALRNAIQVVPKPTADGKVRVDVAIDEAAAFYGRYQEDGFHAVGRSRAGRGTNASNARYVPGLRFMQRAFDSNRGEIVTDVSAAVQAVVAKANR